MAWFIKVFLYAALSFSTSNAIGPFLPKGVEILYDYTAHIKSATDLPAKFASEFYLSAKLRIQCPSDTTILVQLTDAKYKLYNGQTKIGYKKSFLDIPIVTENNQLNELTRPFKLTLYSNGQVDGITIENDEKVFARNLHKALGALFQVKLNNVNMTSIQSDTFVTQEHSIYGKGRTVYTILSKDDQLFIKKMRESVSTERMYQLTITNSEGDICEAPYEEPLAHDSHQRYTFDKTNDTYLLKTIKSSGGLYFYPFRAKSEAHYVLSSVSINFISVTSISSPIILKTETFEKGLTYDTFEPTLQIDENTLKVTTIPSLVTIFDETILYLEDNHMRIDNINIRKAHLSNSAIHILQTCSFDNLESIYNHLCLDDSPRGKQHLSIFYEVLPFVGTHHSIVFVKNIVHNKKVDDEKALDMIKAVTSYARLPTESLLRDTEDMLTWDDKISKSVRKAAALAFGTLIHKTFVSEVTSAKRNKQDEYKETGTFRQHGSHGFAQGSYETHFLKNHTIYKEYMDNLGKMLKTSSDLESQLLYLQVIFNTKLSLSIPHLIPIVKGEELQNHDVREMAFWALSHMLLGNPDLIVQLYWPIVTDPNLHTEFRIAAYYILIKSRPSLTGMLNLHHAMQGEKNTEVYNFHYTYLQAMSQSNDPCNEISKLNAAQILKFTHKPNQQAQSMYYQLNFNDKKYGHGVEVNGVFIAAARSRIFVMDVNMQSFNKRSNYYLLFFKIGGLDKQLSRTVEFNLANSFGLLNYRELWKTLASFQNMKDFQVQISISNNYHTVQLYYFNRTNFHQLLEVTKRLFQDKFGINKNLLNLHYEEATEIIFPTEIGMPASLEMLIPTLTHQQWKLETKVQDNTTTFLIDSKLRGLRSIYWGLHFYNPLLNVFQGIKRYHAYDTALPLYLEISKNSNDQAVSILLKTHADKETNAFGLRSYATNFVYIEDYVNSNVLQTSCQKCENWVQVTRGDAYRFNYTVFNNEGIITGFASQGIIFDTEHHASSDSLNKLMQGANHAKNFTLLEDVLTLVRHFDFTDIFQPSPGTQGFLFVGQPSVTQIDITLSFQEEITQQKNEFLPGIRLNPHLKYQLHNGDTLVKTYNVNAVLESNPGHTWQTLDFDLVYADQNNQIFKICLESNKTWTKDMVDGKLTISSGVDPNEICKNLIVDVSLTGEQLEEQKAPYHVYEVCDSYSHKFKPDYHSMRCLAQHTSIKKYAYVINAHSALLPEHSNSFKELFELYLNKHNDNYNYYTSEQNNGLVNTVKVKIIYTNENDANVKIITPEYTHELVAIPTSELLWAGVRSDNTHFSTIFLWMSYFGMVRTCIIHPNKIQQELNEEKQVSQFEAGKQWTMVLGNTDADSQQAVFLKQYEDTELMALKLVYKNHSLEIYPIDDQEEEFKIVFDGNELSQVMDHYKEDWFSYVIRPYLKSIIVTMFHLQIHLDYTARELVVQTPKVSGSFFSGPCISNNLVEPDNK